MTSANLGSVEFEKAEIIFFAVGIVLTAIVIYVFYKFFKASLKE